VFGQDGKLRHQDIDKIWRSFPASLQEWLLRLTEEYDLTFPLKQEKVNLVPCLMSEREPEVSVVCLYHFNCPLYLNMKKMSVNK
jgi:hypothetical protein